uniref:Uncharacterized protein n=1 Tax=Ascaris lumbricoides TaxID=6252 RepID=A0A9J2NZ98_ASCLU
MVQRILLLSFCLFPAMIYGSIQHPQNDEDTARYLERIIFHRAFGKRMDASKFYMGFGKRDGYIRRLPEINRTIIDSEVHLLFSGKAAKEDGCNSEEPLMEKRMDASRFYLGFGKRADEQAPYEPPESATTENNKWFIAYGLMGRAGTTQEHNNVL